jgi:hypothetical protein
MYISTHSLQISQQQGQKRIASVCPQNRNRHKGLLHDHTGIYRARNQEPIHATRTNHHITHVSTLESDLKLNEGFIPFPMAGPHQRAPEAVASHRPTARPRQERF